MNLHQMLLEAGATIGAAELATGTLGPSTVAAVREWQAHHVDSDGHALTVDGVAGPATLWSLAHPVGLAGKRYTAPGWRCEPAHAHPNVRAVLEVGMGEIGVSEEGGDNRGPRVDVYTKPDLGIPWCAAFASWCYRAAEGGSPFGRFVGSWQFYEWGERHGRIVTEPQAGDVWVILRGDPHERPHGHTGIAAGSAVAGIFPTIEGNAGNAVRGLVRPVSSITAFVRPF
jgi:peptidoglycan hydrolase-like protein with peptidoglycan-binding domain